MANGNTPVLRIAFFQMNPTVGDLSGNVAKMLEAGEKARAQGANLLVTPEMSLVGYPAEDWLLRDDFCDKAQAALNELAKRATLPMLVGSVFTDEEGCRRNALFFLRDGGVKASYFKHHLPEYGVFDEARIFTAGSDPCVIEINGVKLGLAICEDLWYSDVAQQARAAGANILISVNASPYELGKASQREAVVIANAARAGLSLCYVNCSGGQDELIFDGGSFASDADGRVVFRLPRFEENLAIFDVQTFCSGKVVADTEVDKSEELFEALTLATRDYVRKNGFSKVVLGLSGGIDSAVVAAVASSALGAENVLAVMMPTRFTADLSLEEAKTLAASLGIDYVVRPIEKLFASFGEVLAEDFAGLAWSVAEENLQARIRGTLLMAYSNKFNRLVLTTGNKSETAVGYSTLYGDTAGAFAVIKDLYKTEVWALARAINKKAGREVIPESIIVRPPSAELREGQVDQETLPPYDVLDAFLGAYVEGKEPVAGAAVAAGCNLKEAERIARLVHRNEYKRRQSPIGPKVTRLAFGRDWRFPITSHY